MDFVELAYKRLEGRWLTVSAYIDWAEQLLQTCCDAPSIAELASCSWDAEPDPQQVERIFQSCLVELGLTLPLTWFDAMMVYASSLCQQALDGKLDPWDCVSDMLTLSEDNHEPYVLSIWIDLTNDFPRGRAYHPGGILFNQGLNLDDSEECILKTARQFVSLASLALPDKFPMNWWCDACGAISEASTLTEASCCMCAQCGGATSMKNLRFFECREAYLRAQTRHTPLS